MGILGESSRRVAVADCHCQVKQPQRFAREQVAVTLRVAVAPFDLNWHERLQP